MSFRAGLSQEIREAAAYESTRALTTIPFRCELLFSAAPRSEQPTLAALLPTTELVITALCQLGSSRVGLATTFSRFGLARPRPVPAESRSILSSSGRVRPGHVHHHPSLLRVWSRQERSRAMCVIESRWKLPREGDEDLPQREVRQLRRMTIRISRTSPYGCGERTGARGSNEMLTTGPDYRWMAWSIEDIGLIAHRSSNPLRRLAWRRQHTHNREPPRLSLGIAPSSFSCSTTSGGAK